MIYEYFPGPYIQLQKELASGLHPKLEEILRVNGGAADDVDLKLAQIAAYCEVMLDDVYTLEDRIKLCEILVKKLEFKRENPNGVIILN